MDHDVYFLVFDVLHLPVVQKNMERRKQTGRDRHADHGRVLPSLILFTDEKMMTTVAQASSNNRSPRYKRQAIRAVCGTSRAVGA
jgi:hypothetical protein